MKESLPKGDYHLQEERRLCYVASTRARKRLFLMTQERNYHRSSVFIREIMEAAPSEGIRHHVLEAPSEKSVPAHSLTPVKMEREIFLLLRKIRGLETADEAGFSTMMDQISQLAASLRLYKGEFPEPQKRLTIPPQTRFSYTQLETYRYCPLKYQYSYLYQIPIQPTPQMAFGVDLHACLEHFFQKITPEKNPPLEELLASFRRLSLPGRYGEPYEDEEYRQLGIDLLTLFYRKNQGAFAPPLFIEKAFVLQMGEDWIRGFVDRIDPLPGGGVEIIDYKTGKPKKDADAGEQLQLRLYALACKKALNLEPKRVSFYFLRNNEKLSFDHQPEVLEQTKEQILQIIRDIRSSDFTPTPSQQKCRWCDFRNLCPASLARK